MHTAYLSFAAALLATLGCALLASFVYFAAHRSNFLLTTRSPHLLIGVCCGAALTVALHGANEISFASDGESISPYALALCSHLLVPCLLAPLLFRGHAFLIMLRPDLRKRFIQFIRKTPALICMAVVVAFLGVAPFIVQLLAHPAFFDTADPAWAWERGLLFGEARYFLPLFGVVLSLQAAQLWQMRHTEDTMGFVKQLKIIFAATFVFTAAHFGTLLPLSLTANDSSDRSWIRLNYLVLLWAVAVYSSAVVRPLVLVHLHLKQAARVIELYEAKGAWMVRRNAGAGRSVDAGGDTTARSVSKTATVAPSSGSAPSSPKLAGLKRTISAHLRSGTLAMAGTVEGSPTSSKRRGTIAIRPTLMAQNSRSREGSPRGSKLSAAAAKTYSPKPSRRASTSPPGGGGHSWAHTLGFGDPTTISPKLGPRSLKEVAGEDQPRLKSLHDILRYEVSRDLFSEYAARHLCLESCLFYSAVESWEGHSGWNGLDLNEVYAEGQRMYKSFMATGAELEINVPGVIKGNIKRIFGTAQTKGDARKNWQKTAQKASKLGAGTGTATGAAAATSNTTKVPLGRFEAFLSLPATTRRELFRPAQDEVYALLKSNLYAPFLATEEFRACKAAFDTQVKANRAAAALLSTQPAASGASSAATSGSSTPPVGENSNTRQPQYLLTPSFPRRTINQSAAGSPIGSPLSPSRQVQLRMQLGSGNSPLTRTRRDSQNDMPGMGDLTLHDSNRHAASLAAAGVARSSPLLGVPDRERARLLITSASDSPIQSPSVSHGSSPVFTSYTRPNRLTAQSTTVGLPSSTSTTIAEESASKQHVKNTSSSDTTPDADAKPQMT